jgi:uncharacterized protein YdhG (YjbR/CyaY superfamily)
MDKPQKVPGTIDDYISAFPPKVQKKLTEMRQIIRAAAPHAEETISYQMPAFKLKGILVYFGGFKDHIGFFPTGSGIDTFQKELGPYTRCDFLTCWICNREGLPVKEEFENCWQSC